MSNLLQFELASAHTELLARPTQNAIGQWLHKNPADEVLVAEVDPQAASSEALIERYGIDPAEGANCVIIEAVRGAEKQYVAVLVQPGQRADLNGVVRKYLGARRVSFAPKDYVLQMTDMEYGSITPIGLPSDWPVLIDKGIMGATRVIMGSGLVRSKLCMNPTTLVGITHGSVLQLSLLL